MTRCDCVKCPCSLLTLRHFNQFFFTLHLHYITFAAVGHLSQDPESAWEQVRDTAKALVPVRRSKHRPWLTPETLDIIDQKRDARLTGKRDENRRLKGIYKAKADLDEFYNALADEAERVFVRTTSDQHFAPLNDSKESRTMITP